MNDELIAGDTLDFPDSVPDYPPSAGWTLKYRLIPRFTSPAQDPIEITASTSGEEYRVQAAAAVTATWAPGDYTWTRWVEKAGPIRQSVGSGQLKILQNPATATAGYDSRSHNRKMVDLIRAALEGRATAHQLDLLSFSIGTRVQNRDVEKLLPLLSKYELAVAREERGSNFGKVGVRFNRV